MKTSSFINRALALSLGPAVALGLARFGYTVLLPAMRTDLAWTYAQAGSMNTANALGYLGGALIAAPLASRLGTQRAFRSALFLTAMSLLGSGLTDDFTVLLVLRVLAGLGGAVIFINGATLAAHLAEEAEKRSGLVLGLYFGGIGLGILITGLGLPLLLEANPQAWPYAWISMGVLSLLALLPAGRAALTLPALPREQPTTKRQPAMTRRGFGIQFLPSLAAYFLYGLGYIGYMTFVIAFLRAEGVGGWGISAFWLALGASAYASPFVWSALLDRARGGRALALILAVVTAGSAIPLVSTSLASALLSGILFGGASLSVVSAAMNIIRRGRPPYTWASGFAFFTVVFGVGQMLGPLVSGVLTDATGELASGFALSTGLLLLGAILAWLQPDVKRDSEAPSREEAVMHAS